MRVAHILFDLWPRDRSVLASCEPVRSILGAAVADSGARVIHARFHQFEPHGFTGFFLIAESHVSVHSWVEEGWMAVDILSCGAMDGMSIVDGLRRNIPSARERVRETVRGGAGV